MTKKGIAYRDTSRDAWRAFMPASAEMDRDILATIGKHGSIICQDIEKETGHSHQAVSGNLRHLVERGIAEASGDFGHTDSGRKAIRWRLTGYALTGIRPESPPEPEPPPPAETALERQRRLFGK